MNTIKNIPLRTFVLLYKSPPKYVVLASVIALLIGILPSINKQRIAPKRLSYAKPRITMRCLVLTYKALQR